MNLSVDIEKLLDGKHFQLLHDELINANPPDIAGFIEELPVEKRVVLFRILSKDTASEVFANLPPDVQHSLIERLSDKEIFNVIEELFLDDAADFIEEMPAAVAKRVLAHATAETREQINRLMKYPENSAGSIMTVEYIDLKRKMTVAQAFERIRKTGLDKETIYTCYVTDSKRTIEGVVTVKTLLLSEPGQSLNDIMDDNIILAHTDDDRENVAKLFDKYDLLAIPVVDSEKRLVGIITIDDIIDVVREEATEDFEKMAAMTPSEKPYLKTSVIQLFRNRIVWLVVLMVLGMGTGFILQGFEDTLTVVPILISFIPMLTDTGGNAGSQSSTLIIRGLALGEITTRDVAKVIWKELRVSLLAGVVLAAVAFLRVFIINHGEDHIIAKTAVISCTLIFTVFLAKICGAVLPIVAKKLKADPAVMAAPLITTIVDAGSLLVFIAIAKALLSGIYPDLK